MGGGGARGQSPMGSAAYAIALLSLTRTGKKECTPALFLLTGMKECTPTPLLSRVVTNTGKKECTPALFLPAH